MTTGDALSKVLSSYGRYYDIETANVTPPFAAEAVFHSHDEQYFLVRSARISEADSHEYVFFATAEQLDEKLLGELDEAAWAEGLRRTRPHADHHSTDTILVVLAQQITPEAKKQIKRLRRYKSYRWGFQGWTQYRVIAMELSTCKLIRNRQGHTLEKLFRNIFSIKER